MADEIVNTTLCREVYQYAIANLLLIVLLCSYCVNLELCYSCSSVYCTLQMVYHFQVLLPLHHAVLHTEVSLNMWL
jgi:hypothetical protein